MRKTALGENKNGKIPLVRSVRMIKNLVNKNAKVTLKEGVCPGIAHVLAITNFVIYEPIRSDVIIRVGNLHVCLNNS